MDDGDDAVDAVVHPILRELGKRPVGKSPLVEVRGDLVRQTQSSGAGRATHATYASLRS